MEKEQQLLDSFQVEELEKRFEMGWASDQRDWQSDDYYLGESY